MTDQQSEVYQRLEKAQHEARVAERGFRDRAKKRLKEARTETLKADLAAMKREDA